MKSKTFITMVAIGGGLVLVYLYLQKSGIWARWFQAPNEFTDQAKLLAYCQTQNLQIDNGGQAVFIDSTGTRHTASCADWLRAQVGGSDGSGGGQTAGLSAVRTADGTLHQKLRSAAIGSPILGMDAANVDQWNLILRELDPQAKISDLGTGARTMTAEQFLQLRHQAGLTAIPPMEAAYENPMSWVN